MLARDEHQIVGFATALNDGVLSAYIRLLEVLPAFQGQGVGTEIMRRTLEHLANLFRVDVRCDDEVAPFYASFGMQPAGDMVLRNLRPAGGSRRRCDR